MENEAPPWSGLFLVATRLPSSVTVLTVPSSLLTMWTTARLKSEMPFVNLSN